MGPVEHRGGERDEDRIGQSVGPPRPTAQAGQEHAQPSALIGVEDHQASVIGEQRWDQGLFFGCGVAGSVKQQVRDVNRVDRLKEDQK